MHGDINHIFNHFHNDDCPCNDDVEHVYPDLDTAADIVDYAKLNCPGYDDGRHNHPHHRGCHDINNDDGFVYVRRDDLDNLARIVRATDDRAGDHIAVFHAAGRLVDNARPATVHDDTAVDVAALRNNYIDTQALHSHEYGHEHDYGTARDALVAALRGLASNGLSD